MAKTNNRRLTADIEGDFVVFLIGMRINKFWKVHKWWQVFTGMPRMLKELGEHPELGLLGARLVLEGPRSPMVIQYWRSWEDLEAFSRARDKTHFPAWQKFNKAIGSNGDVGIWHETYRVADGQYETVYNNMPPIGLGKASELVPAAGFQTAAARRLAAREAKEPVEARQQAVGRQ